MFDQRAHVLRQSRPSPRRDEVANARVKRVVRIIQRLEDGNGTEEDLDKLLDVGDNIVGRAFCALGDAAPAPITSVIKYFRDEIMQHQKEGGCPFDPAASTLWAG